MGKRDVTKGKVFMPGVGRCSCSVWGTVHAGCGGGGGGGMFMPEVTFVWWCLFVQWGSHSLGRCS